jgi:hypothetical protein
MSSLPSVRAVPLQPLPQPSTIRMRRRRGPPPLPLPMAIGRRCWAAPGRLQPSQGAPTRAASAGGAHTPSTPTLTAGIDRPHSLPLCCKYIFQLLQMFQRYVANVSYRCCKSRSENCICCNGYTRMQAFVSNVLSVLSEYVVSVLIWMLCMFHTYICKCFCKDVVYILQWLFKYF